MSQQLRANGMDAADTGGLEIDEALMAGFEPPLSTAETLPTSEELLHVARLVTVGELSACFAHDVMNPLMMIRGHLSFANELLPADHPARANFEVIERASRRIEEMARRMLDFSRKRSMQPESYEVADLVADSLRFMQPYFQAHHTDVKFNIASGLPRVEVDRWQIIQALVNILQNAAEAMTASDHRTLTAGVTRPGNDILISINDTGRGIADEDLPRIFTPFFTTKGDRGTGLGLYITRKIIDEHRGTITVQTSTRGTTFVIGLPVQSGH